MKFLLLLLIIVTSAYAQENGVFRTHLDENLFIGGEVCSGGEWYSQLPRPCEKGEWLVTVDHYNHCVGMICTQLYVPSFIAKLKRVSLITISTISYYEIIPVSDVDQKTREILEDYWVKFDLNGPAKVMMKEQ